MTTATTPTTATGYQTSFDELGEPLHAVTFVVVDLETTGGSPASAEITEVGAVRVRAGEVLAEFQSLVRPVASIPPFISVLTGITDATVAGAPGIRSVLPAFLEFARGAVLVAHNAPFDLGFLRAACAQTGIEWPAATVVDTARLARRVLSRQEAPDCKLATLSRLFRTSTEPSHRALADARATVDVLHGLLERLGNLGVQSLEELTTYTARVPEQVRRKRHLAEPLPAAPGVYLFRDDQDRILYVGKSRNLRARVRSYFTAAETRARMQHMLTAAVRVDHIRCATGLEAEIRELRLIAEHVPRFNRRSRWPARAVYLRLTDEPFPRLSVVRGNPAGEAVYAGPFGSVHAAEEARAALLDAVPLRQCRVRLPAVMRTPRPACALVDLGRCDAPCDGRSDQGGYAVHVRRATLAIRADPTAVVAAGRGRLATLSAEQRFEEAAAVRDRVAAFVRGSARRQRLDALLAVPELVAARTAEAGGCWEVAVVRYGRLAGAGITTPAVPVRTSVAAIVATAETVTGPGAASAEETECVLRWLGRPGTRLVEVEGCWASPAAGAAGHGEWLLAAPM